MYWICSKDDLTYIDLEKHMINDNERSVHLDASFHNILKNEPVMLGKLHRLIAISGLI